MGKILWVASYPRSGNTWVRVFLHNLLRNPPEPYDINRLQDFTLIDSQARWYRLLDPRSTSELSKAEVAALRPRVHEAMTKAFPDTVFVKSHNALVEDRGTPMLTVEHTAGAIYILRNPLDIAVSYSVHFGVSHDEAVAAMNRSGNETISNTDHFVYEVHGSWSQNVRSWTASPNPTVHVVRYEDMAGDPKRAFGGIAAFLGLRPPADRLARAIRHSTFSEMKAQEQRHGFRERSAKSTTFFRAGEVGEGQRCLRPDLVASLCEAHREQMARFGYWPLPG
jgi:hypothetical protein